MGRQKEMEFGQLGLWDSVKMTLLGDDAVKHLKHYYGKPEWFQQ